MTASEYLETSLKYSWPLFLLKIAIQKIWDSLKSFPGISDSGLV